jgi:aldehyde:ferredoxin oxidoreductase
LASLTPNESIGLAVGPLTGLPCPAGGMAVACVEFERKHRFAPILLNAGLELKLTGFDAVVVEGKSESPVYLWMRD